MWGVRVPRTTTTTTSDMGNRTFGCAVAVVVVVVVVYVEWHGALGGPTFEWGKMSSTVFS